MQPATLARLTISLLMLLSSRFALCDRPIDFHNDIMPLLTKHGCNAGACHGAAIGRGGFELSLYGGDPTADYEAIVRDVGGRRVNLARADQSLIVLKPSEELEHGGGMLFDDDSQSAELLRKWVRQGVSLESVRSLIRVEVTPTRSIATLDLPVELHATAYYDDGSSRDVTPWTVFQAEDSSAVSISKGAQASVLRRGRHLVVARYRSDVIPIELIVPLTDAVVDLDDLPRHNFVDDEVLSVLATLGLQPSPTIDDATFLRRISLDLVGRLPTAKQVDMFLSDADTDKRTKLVDQLLESDQFTQYWTLQLAKLLRIRPQPNDEQGMRVYHRWLSDQIRTKVSYQELARQLILATGDSQAYGPANFYRTVKGPREQTEFVSELFMGSRLRCANCHNHPLDHWTQDDYHGLAAIFAKVESGRVVRNKPMGQTIHPRTLEAAVPRIPGRRTPIAGNQDGREELADWLTRPDNPFFAKAIVNRLWKQLMGRGLVEPVDDFRDTNPATHPALLEALARDFADHGYRLRHTLRVIATSDAYARSSRASKQNKDDDRFYSHALRRRLEPEVLADAISDVLGVSDLYGEHPLGTRAVTLVNPLTPSKALDILGRCGRTESCENDQAASSGLSQKLHLFNGGLLNARIMADGSRLRKLIEAEVPAKDIIDEFYLAALGRTLEAEESEYWLNQLELAKDKQSFLEDLVWSLLTSRDFAINF